MGWAGIKGSRSRFELLRWSPHSGREARADDTYSMLIYYGLGLVGLGCHRRAVGVMGGDCINRIVGVLQQLEVALQQLGGGYIEHCAMHSSVETHWRGCSWIMG